MTELYINGQRVEGVKDVAISLAVTDGVNAVKGVYSKTITVPATATNRQIFNFVEFGGEGGLNKNVEAKAILRVDGYDLITGFAFVEGVKIENADFYNIHIISGNKEWVKKIGDKTLQDYDFGDGDFVFNGIDYIHTYYNLGFIQQGDFELINGNPTIRDIKPFFQVKWILDKIFQDIDLQLEGSDTLDYFEKLYMPLTQKFAPPADVVNSLYAKLYQDDTQVTLSFGLCGIGINTVGFNTLLKDNGGHITGGYTQYESDFEGVLMVRVTFPFEIHHKTYVTCSTPAYVGIVYDVEFKLSIVKEDSSGNKTYYAIHDVIFQGTIDNNNPPSATWIRNQLINVQPGDKLYIEAEIVDFGHTNEEGPTIVYSEAYFEVERLEEYYIGETVQMNDIMPDYRSLDFLKGLKHLFNLRFELLPDNKVRIMTENEYYSSGEVVDISDRVVISKPIDIGWYDSEKYYNLGYKEDTNDKYYNDLTESIGYPLLDKRIELDTKYKDGTKDDKNPFFSGTAMAQLTGVNGLTGFTIPVMKKDNTSGAQTGFAPRILYRKGIEARTYQVDTVQGSQLNYSYVPVFFSYSDTDPNSLSYNDKYFAGLYTRYHRNKFKRLNEGRKVTLYLKLDSVFFANIDFRDTFVINIGNKPEINGQYHLLEIHDYNPETPVTKVTLVEAFAASEDFQITPLEIEEIDPIKPYSGDDITYASGELALVDDGEVVAKLTQTGVQTKYEPVYYVNSDGAIVELKYIEDSRIKTVTYKP